MLRPSGPALPSLRTNWRTLGRQSFSYAWPIRVSSAYSYWVFELFRIAPYPLRGIRSFKRIGRVNFAGVFFLPKYNTRQTVVRIRDSCLDTGSTPAISTILSNMPRKWAFSVVWWACHCSRVKVPIGVVVDELDSDSQSVDRWRSVKRSDSEIVALRIEMWYQGALDGWVGNVQ